MWCSQGRFVPNIENEDLPCNGNLRESNSDCIGLSLNPHSSVLQFLQSAQPNFYVTM